MSWAVTLMRHAESECNKMHRLPQEGLGSSLTESGRAQAAAARSRHGAPARLFSSPARRALQTASAFGRPPLVLEELQELRIGALSGRSGLGAWEEHTQVIKAWEQGNLDASFPDGESGRGVMLRLRLALLAAQEGGIKGSSLAITHAGLIKFAVGAFTGRTVTHVEYCGWVTLRSIPGSWLMERASGLEIS